MCKKARTMAKNDPPGSLNIYRDMWRNLPTAGTAVASKCVKDVSLKLGSLRVIARQDKNGSPESVAGCLYGVAAVEVFGGPASIAPFKMYRAMDLVKRCKNIVGRAWTRAPDDESLSKLNSRIDKLLDRAERM